MADEIHCYATIYCKKQHADDVKKALKDLNLYVTRGSVFVTDRNGMRRKPTVLTVG